MFVAALALLLAPQVVCNAVAAVSPLHPSAGANLGTGRSIDQISSAQIDNGRAARERRHIPDVCSTYWTALLGRSGNVAQQAEVPIAALDLSPVDAHA